MVPDIEAILEERCLTGAKGMEFTDYLIRWKGLPDSDSWIAKERVALMAPDVLQRYLADKAENHTADLLPQQSDAEFMSEDEDIPTSGWGGVELPGLFQSLARPQVGAGGLLARGTRSRPK